MKQHEPSATLEVGAHIAPSVPPVIHPDTRLAPVDDDVGLGIFATRPLPRGTLVWVLDTFDHVLDPPALAKLPAIWRPIVERYAYVDANGDHILCWDAGRYMNHSCEANARGLGVLAQIVVRDIAEGEEVTCDYAECNVSLAPCLCGAARCRGRVTNADLPCFAARWDQDIQEAVVAGRALSQPLLDFTRDPALLASYFVVGARLPSIGALHRASEPTARSP